MPLQCGLGVFFGLSLISSSLPSSRRSWSPENCWDWRLGQFFALVVRCGARSTVLGHQRLLSACLAAASWLRRSGGWLVFFPWCWTGPRSHVRLAKGTGSYSSPSSWSRGEGARACEIPRERHTRLPPPSLPLPVCFPSPRPCSAPPAALLPSAAPATGKHWLCGTGTGIWRAPGRLRLVLGAREPPLCLSLQIP